MRTKRKRVDHHETTAKRLKTSDSGVQGTQVGPLSHNVLSFHYPEVCPLRQFLLNSLSSTSRARRRKITTHKLKNSSDYLDTTLVGIPRKAKATLGEVRDREFIAFTQSQQRSSHSSNGTPEEGHLAEVSFDQSYR